MPFSRIHILDEINQFHQMANGAVRSHHDDIHVFSFSDIGPEAVEHTPLFKANFYQIGLFSEVQFEVSYFGKAQTVHQKNALVIFKPGQTISFTKADPNPKGYAIIFKEHFIDWRLENSNMIRDFSLFRPDASSLFFLGQESFSELNLIAERMHHEYQEMRSTQSSKILRLYCHILLEKINQVSKVLEIEPVPSPQYHTTQEFKSLVLQNVHKTKRVSDYASMLFLTEKTLTNHIRQSTGQTPKDFINLVIVEESKAMLQHRATVDQVADYFNFTDQAHFSHFFRKMTGQSPRSFKKS